MRNPNQINPFEITKAVDYTDQQINDYWVDITGSSFQDTIKPSSPVPMMILGGKGSGKTHLMRYFSYQSQKIRHVDVFKGIQEDGYIGIYMRCGGLNAKRFCGADNDKERWNGVFSYYMDLWLSQITIKVLMDLFNLSDETIIPESNICREIYNLFRGAKEKACDSELNFEALLNYLIETQKRIDVEVNNYPFTDKLEVDIVTTPGELVFSIPEIFANHIPELNGMMFSFFIDEFENLNKSHQKYINTLLREKRLPCTFKIGSRLYGVRTYETYSAEEVNKVGSEYELLHLDSLLRRQKTSQYRAFGKSLCLRRLSEASYILSDHRKTDASIRNMDVFFDIFPKDKFAKEATSFVVQSNGDKERYHIQALRKKLAVCVSGESIDRIIDNLSVIDNPILEKASIYLFYQDWAARKKLLESSALIKADIDIFNKSNKLPRRLDNAISHFGLDFLAQIYRDWGKKQLYLGIDTFITMSSGLPRNLLIILKHVFQWSLYNGEHPFRGKRKISMQAQNKGVLEAAEWFFRDARMSGNDGQLVRAGISNLATLFRSIRFSDKPAECSISTFSINVATISDESLRVIELAEGWSLLINVPGGHRDKNTGSVDSKYQINPMVAPRWDLPVHRRGVIALNSIEVNAIFDKSNWGNFERLLNVRINRMTAPHFGVSRGNISDGQVMLPGIDDE